MSGTPPFRGHLDLHLTSTPSSKTPSSSSLTEQACKHSSASHTTTVYSPFRFAGLQPPSFRSDSTRSAPCSLRPAKPKYGNYTWFRVKRMLLKRTSLILLSLLSFLWWWGRGWREELEIVRIGASEFGLGTHLFEVEATEDLQFFPAANPKIHYVGRWTSTPNRLRKDGTFPGVYFDVTITNTSTIFLSLHNTALRETNGPVNGFDLLTSPVPLVNPGHLSFRPTVSMDKPAPPISLLARIDQEEYILLPNSSSLVSVRSNDLNPDVEHQVRVIAPMIDDSVKGVMQFEGLWISKGGKLLRVEGSLLDEEFADEDELQAENEKIGKKHQLGLASIIESNHGDIANEAIESEDEIQIVLENRKKILEIITDTPGSQSGKHKGRRVGGVDGLLSGVMGWEYLLGEMFSVDHVTIGIDGMCLTQDCIGGIGTPSGMGDVFFRSGPHSSAYFEHPWMFHAYVPDVIIMNLGSSDGASFDLYASEYDRSMWDLSERFEDTYISLIRGIRQLAYPEHPTAFHGELTDSLHLISTKAPASIPIFVMRPFRGQLEHATQGVVDRLRLDGDKLVFWLDTSGWLDEDENSTEQQDFTFDDAVSPARWRLTVQGNQRVAIFLHMHVCRYLARAEEHCAFLPPEVYQGKVYNQEEADLDQYLENEKERKLQEVFREGEAQ